MCYSISSKAYSHEGVRRNYCKRAGAHGDWINLIRQPAIYRSKFYATSNYKIHNRTDHRKQSMQQKLLLIFTTPATCLEHCEQPACWALDVHLMPHSTNHFSVQIMCFKNTTFYTFEIFFTLKFTYNSKEQTLEVLRPFWSQLGTLFSVISV